MLRRIRRSNGARAALALAALLAAGTAFGLHPEPVLADGPAAVAPGISAERVTPVPHTCVACLSHGASLASPLASIALDLAPAAPADLAGAPVPPPRLCVPDPPGRSPPAHS